MSRKIEALSMDAQPDALIGDHVTEVPAFEEYDFPHDSNQLARCADHISRGRAEEVRQEFIMGGLTMPGEDEELLVRFRFECAGVSLFQRCIGMGNKCGLKIVQYDRAGNEIR